MGAHGAANKDRLITSNIEMLIKKKSFEHSDWDGI